jgi:hypothetical protein
MSRRCWTMILLGCLSITSWVHAGGVTLAWDASQRATSYRLYYGVASGRYQTVMDAGAALTVRVEGLTEGTTYYFAATALNQSGESGYSNEVSYPMPGLSPGDTTPPVVQLISPGNGARVKAGTTVILGVVVSDDVELVSVEFLVDGVRRCTVLTVPYECRWAVPSRRNRTYRLEALATDTSDNIGHAAVVEVKAR